MIKNRIIGDSAFGTHLTPLVAAVLATDGNVLELGTGDYSTPVLHEIISWQPKGDNGEEYNRKLVSVENDNKWIENFKDLNNQKFHFVIYSDYKDKALQFRNYSVVFVDNAPAQDRIKAIELFKDKTEIFVVHDTDKMEYYGYTEVFKQFKYIKTYERYKKSTTLLSNYIDVTKII